MRQKQRRSSTGLRTRVPSPQKDISSHQPVKLTKEELDKVRSFVQAGGMLFTNADGDSPTFNTSAAELCKNLFGGEAL